MAEETQLDFRINVGGLNHLGRLNSQVIQLRKGVLQLKPSSQSLTSAFQKQKGVAGQITKIFYGQAQSVKQLVRNQKIFRREIQSQTSALRKARKETKMFSKDWQFLTQSLRKAKRQMRTLPLRKLGTDLQNLSRKAVKAGKNMQWVGRQMMVGITAPMGMLLRLGMRAMESFEKQAMRTRKILALTEDEMRPLRETMKQTARVMGVARSVVAGLTSDFAQMGKKLLGSHTPLTEIAGDYALLTLELELVGQVSSNVGRDFIANLAGIIKEEKNFENRINVVRGLLAKFNMLENTTALSLKDLAEAFPQVSPAAKAAGVELVFLAGVIASMKEVGLNATESAHALKFGLQRMINPTAKVARLSEKYASIWSDFNEDLGMGNEMLFNMAENFKLISKNAGDQAALVWLGELVGKRQASRLYAATMNMKSVADSIEEIGEQLAIVTAMPAIDITMNKGGQLPGMQRQDTSSNVLATDIVNAESFVDVKKIIQDMFSDTHAVEMFRLSVIETDMAAGDMAEGLDHNSKMAAVMAVALKGLDPALRALVIDYMGATEAGKVFTEELEMVLAGPAAQMQKLKNDMKEMLLEFGSAFFEVIEPIIESLRGFIAKITDMPPHMKEAIVVMLGFVAVVGPATFTVAMFTLALGVMSGWLIKLLPKMKQLSSGLLVSKALANEATPAMIQFGGGLAQVGNVSTVAQKKLLKFGGTAVSMTQALRAESTVGMSQYGAYLGTIASTHGAVGSSLAAQTGAFTKAVGDLTAAGITATQVGVAQANLANVTVAAEGVAATATAVGGEVALAANGIGATVTAYNVAMAEMQAVALGTSTGTAAAAEAAWSSALAAMLTEIAAVDTAIAASAAGTVAATATAVAANEAMAVTAAGKIAMIFAAHSASFNVFYGRVMARTKGMFRMMILGRKSAQQMPTKMALMTGADPAKTRITGKLFRLQWRANIQDVNRFARTKWDNTMTRATAVGAKASKVTGINWSKQARSQGKVWNIAGKKATLTLWRDHKIAALKSGQSWRAAGKGAAWSFGRSFKRAYKVMLWQGFTTAKLLEAVFVKSSKMIKLAMLGTGLGAALLIVGAAVVFIIAKFDKFKEAGSRALEPIKNAWNNLKSVMMEVGTAIFAAFEVLFGAEEGTDGMVEGFSGVQKVMEGVGTVLEFLSRVFISVMKGILQPIIIGFLHVVRTVVTGIQTALAFLGEHWKGIGKVISVIVQVILRIIQVWVTMLLIQVLVITKALRVVGKVVFWLLEHAIAPVFSVIVQVITKALDIIVGAIEWIMRRVISLIGFLEPVFGEIFKWLNGAISLFNKLFGTEFEGFEIDIGKLTTKLEAAVTAGAAGFDIGRAAVDDFVKDTLPGLVGGTGDVFDTIVAGIDSGATAVLKGVDGAIDGISDKLTGAIQGTGDGMSGIVADSYVRGIEDGKDKSPKEFDDAAAMNITEAIALATIEGFQQGINGFIGKVKSALEEELAAVVAVQMAAFDAYTEVALGAYDTRIEAINETKDAEKRLTATLKYESDRRAQINKIALDKENFIRNRSLAIYEGRIEDARNLSVKFTMDSGKSQDKLGKLDTDRENTLIEQSRKDAIEQIKIAQETHAELIKLEREAMELALSERIKTLPKTAEEYAQLMEDIKVEVDKGMLNAFGSEAAAAGTLAEFRNIIDSNLKGQFSGMFSDIGVEDLGITSLTTTISTAVTEWGKLVDDQDFSQKFQNIFDEVNRIWKQELEWEKFAHEEFSIHFDGEIAELMAHIKYLKGELEGITDFRTEEEVQAAGQQEYLQSNLGIVPRFDPAAHLGGYSHTPAASAASAVTGGQSLSALTSGVNMTTNAPVINITYSPGRDYDERLTAVQVQPIVEAAVTEATAAVVAAGGGSMWGGSGLTMEQIDTMTGGKVSQAMEAYEIYKNYDWDNFYIPGMASGGYIQEGGLARLHAGEMVANTRAVAMGGSTIDKWNAGASGYEGEGGGGVTIYVEGNFIGQPDWFEGMMKEYDLTVKPASDRAAGNQSRRVTSMSGGR